MRPSLEAWDHRVRTLAKIVKHHTHSAYSGLGLSIQLEWQYLQRNVLGVVTCTGPIKEALIATFLHALLGGGGVMPTSKNPRR